MILNLTSSLLFGAIPGMVFFGPFSLEWITPDSDSDSDFDSDPACEYQEGNTFAWRGFIFGVDFSECEVSIYLGKTSKSWTLPVWMSRRIPAPRSWVI